MAFGRLSDVEAAICDARLNAVKAQACEPRGFCLADMSRRLAARRTPAGVDPMGPDNPHLLGFDQYFSSPALLHVASVFARLNTSVIDWHSNHKMTDSRRDR